MVHVSKKEIHLKNRVVRYTHTEVGSQTVCFMFAGAGYKYDSPLFYYARMMMLRNDIDIVRIDYTYDAQTLRKTNEELTDIMMADIDPVIAEVLESGSYKETIFLGKSIGTLPMANVLMKREEFATSKMILFTPLLRAKSLFQSLLASSHQGLLVIGDQDHHYSAGQIQQLQHLHFKIEVIRNADHSLDVGDYDARQSILFLANVMDKLQQTIRSTGLSQTFIH
ncbi:alpha/beta family hydrolase [Priestia koreensis]|uniref:alpha/beta family hydrolase n=1 Tax=Priestia koreensis TaxID=284581 RepID=UPI0037CB80F0